MREIPDAPWIGRTPEECEEMQGYNEDEEYEEHISDETDHQIDKMKEEKAI